MLIKLIVGNNNNNIIINKLTYNENHIISFYVTERRVFLISTIDYPILEYHEKNNIHLRYLTKK
jgi:hypothetical protein